MEGIYTVKDKKGIHLNIFTQESDNIAIRNFSDAINDKNSILNKHPYDMELWRLGSWDKRTGTLKEEQATYLASGKDFAKENNTITELDKETLTKVLKELEKLEAEQERERAAFTEIKSHVNIINEKYDNTRLELQELNRVAKKKRR